MKSSFSFDGDNLQLRLNVDGKTEQAMAALMESHTVVDVTVEYEQYGYGRSDSIKSIRFMLRKPQEA